MMSFNQWTDYLVIMAILTVTSFAIGLILNRRDKDR